MMRHKVMFAAAWLALSAGTAFAAIPNTSDELHRTMPMISGTVVSVDDRQIVVDTDQGQRVSMVMDSRTMLPTDLAPGMVMRADFRVMENGQYYASRITPIRDAQTARGAEATTQYRGEAVEPVPARTTSAQSAEQPARTEPANEPVAAYRATEGDAETLPQTAGRQPLIALLGMIALGGAGTLMLARRSRRA